MSEPAGIVIFAIGFLGALAPEIVRLYRLRYQRNHSWSWFYVLISALFGGLGGTIALILPSTTYFAAFYAGVSTPILISTILRNAGAGKMQPAEVEATRTEVQRRARMSAPERSILHAQENNGAAGGAIGMVTFGSMNRRLLLHDFLSSL